MKYDVPQILRLGETRFKTLAISHETWKTLLCSLGLAAPPRPSSGLLLCGLTYQAGRLEPATGWSCLPSGYVKISIEHGPFIVDLPIKDGDFP